MNGKIVVPEGMSKAVSECGGSFIRCNPLATRTILTYALRWLSENPIVPTDEQYEECLRATDPPNSIIIHLYQKGEAKKAMAEWQRRMFLAPEPETPKELESLLYPDAQGIPVVLTDNTVTVRKDVNDRIIEAYRRGQNSNGSNS